MSQDDWIGDVPRQPFKDIRNTRPSVAEEKAQLALQLTRLIAKVPATINSASVNRVREWRAAHENAAKVAASKKSSVQQLTAAINSMRRFLD